MPGDGAYVGCSTKQDVMITSSTAGASYSGGFKGNDKSAEAIRSVAGPAPTNIVLVKDGEFRPPDDTPCYQARPGCLNTLASRIPEEPL